MRFLFFLFLVLISTHTFASNNSYHCEITTFGSMSKAEKSWIPEKFILYPNEKSIQLNSKNWYKKYHAEVAIFTETRLEMNFYDDDSTYETSKQKSDTNKYNILYLPLINKVNIKMFSSGFRPIGPAFGKCEIKTTKKTTSSNSNDSTSNMMSAFSDKYICQTATTILNQKRIWANNVDNYISEAKKRNLNCSVGELVELNASSSSINSNLNSSSTNSKLNNAKLECADIGYKKGTEKFADCVMKLIEN